jgi:hypothetical protein
MMKDEKKLMALGLLCLITLLVTFYIFSNFATLPNLTSYGINVGLAGLVFVIFAWGSDKAEVFEGKKHKKFRHMIGWLYVFLAFIIAGVLLWFMTQS